jgi:hypothetical protein
MSLECELFERARQLATDAHRVHLVGTDSGYHRMVLDGFYHDIVDKADAIMDAYLGRCSKKITYADMPQVKEMRNANVLASITMLRSWIDNHREKFMQESEVQNAIDELVSLLDSTRYKLAKSERNRRTGFPIRFDSL